LQTEHRTILCSEEAIGQAFPDVVWHAETPMLRTAPAPMFQLSGLVRDADFKVVLTGEGADEIFAGYNIFREMNIRRHWARQPESKVRPRLLEKLYPYIFQGRNEKAKAYLQNFYRQNLADLSSPVYSHLLRWHNTTRIRQFLVSENDNADNHWVAGLTDRFLATAPDDFASWHPLTKAQFIEMELFMSNYLLSTQGDRMAMAHSIEGRYPFLDYRVIEFAFNLPERFRLNGLTEKFILKKAARGIVPDTIIQRDKQPYRAPIGSVFFRTQQPEYVEDLLSAARIGDGGYFSASRVTALVNKCRQSPAGRLSERENMALVGVLSTQLLDHQFIRHFPHHPSRQPTRLTVAVVDN
jgi:asparagine synthase (glutamine-hydrolysing)